MNIISINFHTWGFSHLLKITEIAQGLRPKYCVLFVSWVAMPKEFKTKWQVYW